MRGLAVVMAVALVSPVRPLPLHAQWRADAEIGAGRVTQPEAPVRAAATAGASLAWLRESMAVVGFAGVTLPSAAERRAQGELAASLRSDPGRTFGLEATGVASAYDERRFRRMLSASGGVRVHARAGPLGVWGGGAAGALDDGTFTYPHTVLEAGASTTWRAMRLTVAAAHNSTLGEPRIEFTGDPPRQVTVRDRLRYTDAGLTVQGRPRRVELDGRVGQRRVHRTIASEERPSARIFGAASAAWWVTPRVAVAGSLGHELADLARGLPEARYATLGVRVRLHDSSPATARPVTRRPIVTGGAPDLLIERGGADAVTLRVLASPSVRTIEVAGTFTEWEPRRLVAEGGGVWSLAVPLVAGHHRVMVRVDGGEWMPPANLPSVDDELGGRVGLFTVPGRE